MKCWKIGEVTVTRIVERDLMGLLNKVIPDATLDAIRALRWLFGVDPTLVSPAAKSITTEPIGRSCRDQTGHMGSRAPKSAQKMYGKPLIQGFRIIRHGDRIFRTSFALSWAVLQWLLSACRKTSVSRQINARLREV